MKKMQENVLLTGLLLCKSQKKRKKKKRKKKHRVQNVSLVCTSSSSVQQSPSSRQFKETVDTGFDKLKKFSRRPCTFDAYYPRFKV